MNAISRMRAPLAAVFALALLAACDREPSETAQASDGATVGQKLDVAIDRTQKELAVAGEKAREHLATAGEKISAATDRAVDRTKEAAGEVKNTPYERGPAPAGNGEAAARDTRATLGDAAITASIKTDFLKDPDLSVLKIDVDTRDGVVTLNGLADNDAARQRAGKMASAVKGVREVRNYLTIKRT